MKEIIKLVIADLCYADEIRAYRQEFIEAGDSLCASLQQTSEPEKWLAQVQLHSDKDTVPEGGVLYTQFLYVREADKKIVGMIQVRHDLNEHYEKYGGHIGYSVRPSERQKGYAKQMLQECLPYCREIGLAKVLLTCTDTNEASRRTILACGGLYESTIRELQKEVTWERYWIQL